MNTIATLLSPLMSLLGHREASQENLHDCNDPAEGGNLLGTVCEVHGCERQLGEAPVVPIRHSDEVLANAKRRLFPNSWTVIGTFGRNRKHRTIAVRYCDACRAEAGRWIQAHSAQ